MKCNDDDCHDDGHGTGADRDSDSEQPKLVTISVPSHTPGITTVSTPTISPIRGILLLSLIEQKENCKTNRMIGILTPVSPSDSIDTLSFA